MFELKGLYGKTPVKIGTLCGPHAVQVQITGATKPDAAGHHMHLLYTLANANGSKWRFQSWSIGPILTVADYPAIEFDARGGHELAAGDLYLVGGDPGDVYQIEAWNIPLRRPALPAWHWLSTFVDAPNLALTLTVPRYHSRLRAVRGAGDVGIDNAGMVGLVGPMDVMLTASASVSFRFETWAQTAWLGC